MTSSRRKFRTALLIICTALPLLAFAQEFAYGKVHRVNVPATEGGLADTPRKMVEHLRAQNLVTDADLEGDNVFAELVALYLPSLLGKMPNRRFALYVPPDHRAAVQIGRLVQVQEGGWTGMMGTRVRKVVAVFDPERDAKLYAECGNAYEIHQCVREYLRRSPTTAAPTVAVVESPSDAPVGASEAASR